jgi:CubicO group peptidase (beta-lactamase class C family)
MTGMSLAILLVLVPFPGAPAATVPGARVGDPAVRRRAAIQTESSALIPSAARSGLALAEQAGKAIQTFAFTPRDEFVLVTANRPLYSPAFPAGIRSVIDALVSAHKTIDVIAFGKQGQWLVVAGDTHRESGLTASAQQQVTQRIAARQRITSFAFSNADPNGWVLTAAGSVFSGGRLPAGMAEAIAAARAAQRPVHEIAMSLQAHWALVADDWYATDGLGADLLGALERFRTTDRRRIDHVVFNLSGGTRVGWSIISNTTEPVGNDRMSRIENRLTPANRTIYQRMQTYSVPGLALVLVEKNQIAWQRSYGLRRNTDQEGKVYPNTIFEAASISKPITAVGVLQLVADRAVALHDSTILDDLVAPSSRRAFLQQFANPHDINLNLLLSHCAGVVHANGGTGVQSFGYSSPLPGITDVMMGSGGAGAGYQSVQTASLTPGVRFSYSGANYAVVQAIIDKYSAHGFDRQMRDLLSALEMTSSTYSSPAPWNSARFARAHTPSGSVASVLAYANQGAASISTTAGDLAHFVIMLNQHGSYHGRQVLQSGYVLALGGQQNGTNAMCANRNPTASPRGSMGLGIWANSSGTWSHGGSHNGYRSFMYARPADRWGLVILTNGGQADPLAVELFRAIETDYGLPRGTLAP